MRNANDMGEIVDGLQFRVLGPVQVLARDGTAIDVGGAKPRLVLVQLVLSPNRVVTTDALVDALWGEDPPPTARRSLQSHVAKLRAALGGDGGPVRSRPPGYLLAIDEEQVDLWRSEELIRQARGCLLSNPRHAHHLAQQACLEWTGDPLADLALYDQLVPQRRRLDKLWLDLIELELDTGLAVGDTAEALQRLEALVLDRPEHEPFWARLMTSYYRVGRQSDALAAFQRARSALLESLGIDPSPALRRLEVAILGQAAELDDVHKPVCPYKGLASYQFDDAELFFGRDDLVAELVEAVRSASFVVVVGSSGAGKSSALRAGLVKAIEARKVGGVRFASIVTPGTAPLRSIYQVPRSVDIVIVDQFEELFTLTDDETIQREFVRALLAKVHDGEGRVVISLRGDFYGHCTKIPELAPWLARRQVVVGPMSEQELRLVITKPAENAGLIVAQELVDVIVAEAADRPGALPLVSHALVETWHRRVDNHLTLEAYRDAGSIAAAIARTAERIYDGFQPAQRVQAERLFLRLVEPGEGTEHTRRRVPYGQLEGSSIDREEIDLLVEARLLTAGADGIEIAHEALIDSWPRLRSWIDDNRDGMRMHRHLTTAATAWSELGRDEGELYRGARLSAALSWVADGDPDLSDLERSFLDAAVEASDAHLRQQVRTNRRLRILVAASVVGVMVAAIGILQAVSQTHKAQRGRAVAEATQLVEAVRTDAGLSDSVKLQLAVEADRRASTLATKGLMLDAIAGDSGVTASDDVGVQLTGNTSISADGGVLVGIDNNSLGLVLDAATLKPLVRNLRPAPTVVVDTGKHLLGLTSTDLKIVDLETREIVSPPRGPAAGPTQVALSLDGTTLAVAKDSEDSGVAGVVSLYDVTTGGERASMRPMSGSIRDVTFSPDGRRVLAVVGDDRAIAWNTATAGNREDFASPPDDTASITRVAFSPSNKLLAIGRKDGHVGLWRSDDGRSWLPVHIQSSHSDAISWIDFDSDSQRMVTTSRDGAAIEWDTATGLLVAGPQDFQGSGGPTTFFEPGSSSTLVNVDQLGRTHKWEPPLGGLLTSVPGVNVAATISAEPGTRVVLARSSGVMVYDPAGGIPRQVTFDSGLSTIGAAASSDGKRFVAVHSNGDVDLGDTASGHVLTSIEDAVEVTAIDKGRIEIGSLVLHPEILVAIDHAGSRAAFQAADQRIQVVDDKGTTVKMINLPSGRRDLQSLALSDDGSELVVSTKDGQATWYDLDEGDTATIAPPGAGFDAQFVAQNEVAVTGRSGARIIDPRSHVTTRNIPIGTDVTRFAVDSTGRLLASDDATGSVQLWDATLGVRIGGPVQIPNVSSAVPIRFSADGHYLLVSGPTETTWIDVSTADWPRLACNLVTDPLSSDERTLFLGSRDASDTCP